MSEASLPRPLPQSRRCRALCVSGIQCRHPATRGHHLCHVHRNYGHPRCPTGPNIAIPLLEDDFSIRLLATQVAQGLLAQTLDTARAGKVLYACQVAALTIPRPARLRPPDNPLPVQEPVVDATTGPDGAFLGPDQNYAGPVGTLEPSWSFSKYLYEQECKQLGRAIPTSAAEYPPSGWLTADEMQEDPAAFGERYAARIAALRQPTATSSTAAESATACSQPPVPDLQAVAAPLPRRRRCHPAPRRKGSCRKVRSTTVPPADECVRGQGHTPGSETSGPGFSARAREQVAMGPFHLSKYVDEQASRSRHRAAKPQTRTAGSVAMQRPAADSRRTGRPDGRNGSPLRGRSAIPGVHFPAPSVHSPWEPVPAHSSSAAERTGDSASRSRHLTRYNQTFDD